MLGMKKPMCLLPAEKELLVGLEELAAEMRHLEEKNVAVLPRKTESKK